MAEIELIIFVRFNKRVIDNLYSDINNDGMLLINSIYAREDYNKNFRNKINSTKKDINFSTASIFFSNSKGTNWGNLRVLCYINGNELTGGKH